MLTPPGTDLYSGKPPPLTTRAVHSVLYSWVYCTNMPYSQFAVSAMCQYMRGSTSTLVRRMLDDAIVSTAFAERLVDLVIKALRNTTLVGWMLDSHITISTNFTTDCPDVLLQVYSRRLGTIMESLLIAAQRDRCCGSGEIGPARKVVRNIRFATYRIHRDVASLDLSIVTCSMPCANALISPKT